ncbi:MAG: helix-turn-helix transcriptional regulator [Clostridia bacterium]|nr:helix-turn-helix transcriptional regulator [Clostridia bacterium]
MKLEEAITKRIYALCEERNISPNKLASLSGMPAGSMKSIFYGKSKNPGTRTLLDMCQALEISLYDFFNDDLFKNKDLEGTY